MYGRLPYQNSLFYPYIDPTTGLPIIDPGIMAQLDPNSKKEGELASPSQQANDNTLPMSSEKQAETAESNFEKQPELIDNLEKQMKNESNETNLPTQQRPKLDYKYEPANYTAANNIYMNPQNLYDGYNQHNYNLCNYNDQSNYDLYYQSLYQMYPQMSDVKFNYKRI